MTQRYLRRSEVELIAGLSKATIYRRIANGTFPPPVRIGGNSVRWRRTDLVSWQDSHRVTASAAND